MIEVKGNGNIVSKDFQVSSFLRLHLSAKGLIEIIQSDEEKVVITVDENLLDYFEVVNAGRTLYLTSSAKFRKPVFTSCNIQVYLRQLEVLNILCDGGDVMCPEEIRLTQPLDVRIQSIGDTRLFLNAPSIKLVSRCEGNVNLKGECQLLEIKNQSVGNFIAREMIAQDLSIRNMAEGDVELCAEKTIAIRHFGEGYVHYYGNAILKDVKQYGAGAIKRMQTS